MVKNERQVHFMTRDEAIRILDPETTAEALVEYEYYGGFNGKTAMVNAVNDACEVAVAALREQLAPAMLDRSRWEGCEFCQEALFVKRIQCLRPATAPLTQEQEIMDKLAELTGTTYCKLESRFCPICGRPLTEETWAELERRINDGAADIS